MTAPRPVLRVGAYAVVERDGAVLLARWVGSDPPRWTLPGGGLHHGQDPRAPAGRWVANVVADWAPRHGEPFVLELTGPAGATFTAGADGISLRMDAIEFCRTLSGREVGSGILATPVAF